jgi:hypothetical protein
MTPCDTGRGMGESTPIGTSPVWAKVGRDSLDEGGGFLSLLPLLLLDPAI